MNKKLIASGIIFVFLIVGLSGCQDIGIGITNIGDITANPENYIGKEVKIEGKCEFGKISDDKGHTIRYRYDNTISGSYRLTGIIKSEYSIFIDVKNAKAL